MAQYHQIFCIKIPLNNNKKIKINFQLFSVELIELEN